MKDQPLRDPIILQLKSNEFLKRFLGIFFPMLILGGILLAAASLIGTDRWNPKPHESLFWICFSFILILIGSITMARGSLRRTHAEQSLENALHERNDLISAIPDVFIVLDRDGCLMEWNQKLEEITGKTRDELCDLPAENLFQPGDQPTFRAFILEVLDQTVKSDFEGCLVDRDGANLDYQFNLISIHSRDGKTRELVGIGRDVTAQKQAEGDREALTAELSRQLRNMDALLSTTPEHFHIHDREGRFLYASPIALQSVGLTAEEVFGKSWRDLGFPEATGLDFERRLAQVFQTGEQNNHELQFPIDAGLRTMEQFLTPIRDEDGAIVSVLSTVRDITERKTAEEELRRSEEKYRHLFETNMVGMYQSSLSDGRILEANPTLLHMFNAQSMVGEYASDFYVMPADREILIQSLQEKHEVENYITELKRQDGSTFWASLSATLFPEEGFIEGVILDISEQVHAEQELEKSLSILQATLEATTDGIITVDNQQNLVNYNQQFFRLWGIHKPLSEMVAMEPQERVRTISNQTLDPDQFIRGLEEVYTHPEVETHDMVELKDGRIFERIGKPHRLGNAIIGRVWSVRDITERKRAEEALQHALVETQKATQKMEVTVTELERRATEASLLNEMGDLLQTCNTAEEAYAVVSRYARQLFPEDASVLGILSPSRNLVEIVMTWGNPDLHESIFPTDVCWALRRGRIHWEDNVQAGTLCKHVNSQHPLSYICIPLIAHGESLGLLHIQIPAHSQSVEPAALNPDQLPNLLPIESEENQYLRAKKQLAVAVAERIALSLANLKLRETLREQAILDPLTGLYNRRYMQETLEREIRKALRQDSFLSIMIMDVDYFKRVNDTYGHQAGDLLLREIAIFLQRSVRAEDVCCRFGGEEFVIIMPGMDQPDALKRAEQILEKVCSLEVDFHGQPIQTITLSIGVAVLPDHGTTTETLLRAADDALYHAKLEGRNRIIIAQ